MSGTTTFPPSGPTTLTQTIPAYLYQEYSDDDDLQAFVDSFNAMAQQYVDWFNAAALPIYPIAPASFAIRLPTEAP